MNRTEIENTLASLAKRYFPSGVKYTFGGFAYSDNHGIAEANAGSITFNEKYINLRNDQIERTLVHELQHAKNWSDVRLNDGWYAQECYSFVFHPKFRDLYNRSQTYYAEKVRDGARLELKFHPLPKTFREAIDTYGYSSPDEFLARLRGYEHYLNQVRDGVEVETLAYESIETFEEGDLNFLNLEYREHLASELRETNPKIFNNPVPEIQIKKETEGESRIEIHGYNIR